MDGLVLIGESVTSETFWGYEIPKSSGTVQLDIGLMGFILRPGEHGASECKVKGTPAFRHAPAGSMKDARSGPKIWSR
jgi:hypothetical protein